MKLSRYNWIVEHDGNLLAFNGFTGALASVDQKNRKTVTDLFSGTGCTVHQLDSIDDELKGFLAEGGFLIEDDFDEVERLNIISNIGRYNSHRSAITVVPTTACNFSCTYCFEQLDTGRSQFMSGEVIDAITKLVANDRAPSFFMGLYGGEPLLALEQTILLLEKGMEATGKRGARFASSLVTNGYLLTEEVARNLSERAVGQAQITIDGDRDTHNRTRPLRNGDGTFDRILANAIAASRFMKVNIRVNVDASRPPKLDELERAVEGCENIDIHLAPVQMEHTGDTSALRTNTEYCMSSGKKNVLHMNTKTNARIAGCGAACINGIVIMPDGAFLRCWEEVGGDYDYGNITKDDSPLFDRIEKWMKWNPYSQSSGMECYSCRYLPTCAGSCPRLWVEQGRKRCQFVNDDDYKHFIIHHYLEAIGAADQGRSSSATEKYDTMVRS